jgi:hypothetical protein
LQMYCFRPTHLLGMNCAGSDLDCRYVGCDGASPCTWIGWASGSQSPVTLKRWIQTQESPAWRFLRWEQYHAGRSILQFHLCDCKWPMPACSADVGYSGCSVCQEVIMLPGMGRPPFHLASTGHLPGWALSQIEN